MDTTINTEEEDYSEDNRSTFFSPHTSLNSDAEHEPLNNKDFSKIFELNLAKHPPKRFVYLFPVWLEEKLRGFDDPIIKLCQRIQGKTVYYFSLFITSIVAIEIAIALPFLLFILGQDALATEFTYLGLLLALLSQVPKRFLWRFRPYMVQRARVVKKDQTSSFPSRAVTCSVVYSFAIVWAVSYYKHRSDDSVVIEWWMPFLFIIMIALSSFARVNLGVHYPSDCVGGVIQGVLVCLIGTGLRKADILGCRSCWDYSCYASDVLCVVIPIVSVMKPVDFWSKCDRVYGMLFPAAVFQLLLLCPKSYNLNASLPKPLTPHWYSFIFGISLNICI
eukprot:gene7866-9683_t